jgi:hypothetical protein
MDLQLKSGLKPPAPSTAIERNVRNEITKCFKCAPNLSIGETKGNKRNVWQ